jgi:hypothetical protein
MTYGHSGWPSVCIGAGMPKAPVPPPFSKRELVLELRARDEFVEGELGLASPQGVVAVDLSLGVPPGCFLVRAVAKVSSGQFGKFVETAHSESQPMEGQFGSSGRWQSQKRENRESDGFGRVSPKPSH